MTKRETLKIFFSVVLSLVWNKMLTWVWHDLEEAEEEKYQSNAAFEGFVF